MIGADLSFSASINKDLASRHLNFLWLEITSKCNLVCNHCYANSGPFQPLRGKMETADWIKVLEDGVKVGCRQMQFIGGEPTLHPDFKLLVNVARSIGYDLIEVYTNATTITRRLASFLADRQVSLATSFYSPDPCAHDRVTGKPGSFDLTIRGIKHAVEANIEIRAGVIETSHNAGHCKAAGELLNEMGVMRVGFDRERGIGRGLSASAPDSISELCGQCSKGKLCVTAEADVYPCVFSRFAKLGNVVEDGLENILMSGALQKFCAEMDARWPNSNRSANDDEPCGPSCGPNCEPWNGCNPERHCVPNCVPARSCNPCAPNGGGPCSPDVVEPL